MANETVRYRIEADTGQFTKAISAARKEFAAFGLGIAKAAGLGAGLGAGFKVGEKAAEALVAAVKAIPAAIIGASKQVIALGDGLADLSKQTGIATQGLQKMHFAASLAGVSAGEVNVAVGMMQRSLVQGGNAFKQLGLDAAKMRAMAPEAAFAQIAQRITQIKDASGQSAAAMEIFGRSGAKLLPVMKSDLAAAYVEAERLGIVLGKDAVDAADALGDELTRMSSAWDGVINQFGSAIITSDGVQDAFKDITDVIKDLGQAVKDNKAEIQVFFEMIADSARFAILGLRGVATAIRDMAKGTALGDMLAARVAANRAGSGLSGGAKFKDASGNPLAADLAHLDPSQAKTRSFIGSDQVNAAEAVRKAWQKAAEDARKAWDDFYHKQGMKNREMLADIQALLTSRANEKFGGTAQGAFDQMQRMVSKGMGGSGKLLSEETTNVSKFWSRDPAIADELKASGGKLFTDATKSGVDFSKMLGDVAHAFQVLGVGSNSVLGKFVGSLSVIGGALDSLKAANASGATGLSGFLGKAVPILGLASAGIGLVKGLFGGGKSKEEKEAERKKAEDDKRRIQDAAKAMRSQSIDSLGGAASAFFMGRTITTEDDAKRSGTLFIDAWTQVVKEKGVLAAADAFGGAFDKMKADIEKAGIAMPDWMKAIEGQMGLSKNEGFRAAATGSQNAASFLGALGGAGGLSPESFRAFEQEARAQFAAAEGAAKEAGLDAADATKAGFSATNPLLKELLNQSVVTGQTLSDDIQAMVDAAGIVPDVDIQQLSELQQIRAAVQAMAGGGGLPGPAAGGPGGGSGGSAGVGSGEDRYPGFATGGNVTRTGLALVHQGEQIISKSDVATGGNNTYHINVQASGNKQTDEALVANLMNTMARLTRKGKGRQFMSALGDDGFARKGKR